jgi:hypothetical protein
VANKDLRDWLEGIEAAGELARASKELDARIRAKWSKQLPKDS